MTKIELYAYVPAQFHMLASENAPIGAFCNASMLKLVITYMYQ